MKKFTVLVVLLVTTGLVYAQPAPQAEQSSVQSSVQSVDVGNKHCPVSGRPIGVMGPGIEETYKGRIYHLCCGGCVSTFESDPEKYSKIAEDDAKITQ